MERRRPNKTEPTLDGGELWGVDPHDVRRYARRMRQAREVGPLGKLMRIAAVVLVLVGAFLITWNFESLSQVRVDFSGITGAFSRSTASGSAGGDNGGEPGTEVIEDSSIAGGVSLPTSIKGAEPAPEETSSSANETPAGEPAAAEPTPAPAAAPPSSQSQPAATVARAVEEQPRAVPPPPREPEGPVRPETFGFGLEVMKVSEADASAAVLVLRDGGRRRESFITWWTSNGRASSGSDFARLERRVERFGVGEQNRTLFVPIIGDRNVEGAENFYVHIAAGDSQTAPEVAKIEVVIVDDD
jgi:hypothetical protein